MKHNWSSAVSYDTERIPVNREARQLMSKQPVLDLQDPNVQEAMGIAENLQGAHALARGVSTTEVASLLCGLLKKRETVQTTIAPEVLALKQQELIYKREVFNSIKQARKDKAARLAAERIQNASFLECFKDMAKETMAPDHYSILMDLALEECKNRKAALTTPTP